ncbi:DUF3311 domain-containing protein [Streptacidiphilus cavernicola]|uniref:DUF3311 domain-containing protein n=1 Tax=Streptacidiphilus cavernicola TaxID=3342716 RepID=A0ABV6VUY9_9ACTN
MAETAPPSTPARPPLVTPTRIACAVLLAAPFVALLWVGSYSRLDPAFIGVPFFYWYQLAWVVLSAVFTGAAYLLFRREETARAAVRAAAEGGGPE